jgi:Pregnancy-associated plasma protein-A
MRKIIILLILISGKLFGQNKSQAECGTPTPAKAAIISKEQMTAFRQIQTITEPYAIKVFITVFANNDGSDLGATDSNIKRQYENMVNQYSPHGICFLLAGIKQVNSTDLNDFNKDTEASELTPYLVPNMLNLFIHNSLYTNTGGLNGTAYSIPSTKLSVSSGFMADFSNLSTMGHEVGHCLNLYHTFETEYGAENVARTGVCSNCTSTGDYLCDTQADMGDPYLNDHIVACAYNGTQTDACNTSIYAPDPTNMMTYGERACRANFTTEQITRMKYYLINDVDLNNTIAQDIVYYPVIFSSTLSSGTYFTLARDVLNVSEGGANLTINGTANQSLQAKKVTLKSGTKFSPSIGGKISVKSNPYCN